MAEHRRYPLNAAGDFYVADGHCIACEAPEHEAPELMQHDHDSHCYFQRQPETTAELDRAIMAVVVGCCEAVRYSGTDQTVLRRLARHGLAGACDHSLDETL